MPRRLRAAFRRNLTLLSSSVEQNRGKPSSLRGLLAATSQLRESQRVEGRCAFRACSAAVLFAVHSARGADIHGTLMWALFMQLLGVLPGTESIRPYLVLLRRDVAGL